LMTASSISYSKSSCEPIMPSMYGSGRLSRYAS
jgi:hypothetical protein